MKLDGRMKGETWSDECEETARKRPRRKPRRCHGEAAPRTLPSMCFAFHDRRPLPLSTASFMMMAILTVSWMSATTVLVDASSHQTTLSSVHIRDQNAVSNNSSPPPPPPPRTNKPDTLTQTSTITTGEKIMKIPPPPPPRKTSQMPPIDDAIASQTRTMPLPPPPRPKKSTSETASQSNTNKDSPDAPDLESATPKKNVPPPPPPRRREQTTVQHISGDGQEKRQNDSCASDERQEHSSTDGTRAEETEVETMPVRDHDSDQDIHDDSHIQPYNGVENSVEGPTNKVKLLETQGESPLPAALEPTVESWLSTVDSQETSTPVSPEQQATKEAHKAAPYTHDTSMPKTFDVPSNDYSARLHDEYSQFQYTTQQRPQPSTMRQPNVDRPPIDQPHPQQRQIPHRKMTAQPQRYRPTPSAPAKTVMPLSFKTLWGKVERKLDGLEGAVKHQAQRLASQAPKVTSSIADKIPSGSIPLPRKSRRSVTMTPATSVPLKPYGQKYQIAREANQRQKDAKNNVMPGTKKTSDWNTLVMSSGGATPPNGGGHPLSNGNKANGPLLTPGATGPSFSTASMSSEQRYGTPPVSERPRAETSLSGSYGQGIPTSFQSHGQADSSSHSGNSPTQKQLPRAFASSSAAASQQIQAMPPSAPNRFVPDDDDTDDGPGLKHFLGRLVPPIPRFGKLFRFRFGVGGRDRYQYASMDAWKVDEEEEDGSNGFGLFGLFRKKKRQSASLTSTKAYLSNDKSQDAVPPSISRMLSRCDNAQTTSLLQHSDVRASRFIGRYQAILDVAFLLLIMLGLQQMSGFEQLLPLPKTWDDIVQVTIPKFGSILNETMMGTWAFFAFLYAYLSSYAREVLLRKKIEKLSLSVAECVNEESEYSQLYLRLVAAIPFQENLPSRLAMMAKTQIRSTASKARLDSYVTIVLASLIIMTISVVIPMLTSIFSACVHILMLEEFRNWPVPWKAALDHIGMLLKELFLNLESLGAKELKELFAHPKQFAFHAAMFASFVGCSLLPRLEEKRIIKAASTSDDEDDFSDEMASSNMESAEEWSRLGMSSASRLTMLSEHGSVETALERWRASRAVAMAASSHRGPPLLLILRLVGYTVLAALLAVLPLVVSHYVVGKIPSLSSLPVPRWDSMVDLTFLQVFLFVLTHRALRKVLESTDHVSFVKQFLTDLAQTKDEMKESNKRQGDVQVMASISASAGLIVRDLWSAHTTKRAWAVRGASLQCKNGEVLAILGDDGEGKTRLLTTLAESLMFPPKRSLTTNKVRGYIAVGGLEASKWDRKLLKRRMGVLLSDVRMTADSASLFSGWTMEEILEPVDGVRSNHQGDPLQRKLTPAEKSSMLLALKITGLYSTLLHKLPSKLSTIFTANEEDLRPSSLKPLSQVLSPGEWSKLILARVLAQTIYDNDNALASSDKLENSLVGSVLLLDDPTVMLSEIEEGKLLKDLRQTGAATILTTNKWATGRFADHICVVKDGMIVESGSHNDLISRGPQQSLYAAKWHAMTMQ